MVGCNDLSAEQTTLVPRPRFARNQYVTTEIGSAGPMHDGRQSVRADDLQVATVVCDGQGLDRDHR